MNHGFRHYHPFSRAPSPSIPISLTCWPSPENHPPHTHTHCISVHLLFFFTLFWNKSAVTESLWENQIPLPSNTFTLYQTLKDQAANNRMSWKMRGFPVKTQQFYKGKRCKIYFLISFFCNQEVCRVKEMEKLTQKWKIFKLKEPLHLNRSSSLTSSLIIKF